MDLIDAYTRAHALQVGLLIDVTATAKECGIRYQTALSASVWNRYVELPKDHESGQDRDGRLWDLLFFFRTTARQTSGSTLRYHLFAFDAYRAEYRTVLLKAICGQGDEMQPVITILLPHED
ncbi:MAG: hypothetical protein KDA93_27975 [Planctomycetaceae bacterium]|nr:hypothetical protein [Planctomycetaceae bacterium]